MCFTSKCLDFYLLVFFICVSLGYTGLWYKDATLSLLLPASISRCRVLKHLKPSPLNHIPLCLVFLIWNQNDSWHRLNTFESMNLHLLQSHIKVWASFLTSSSHPKKNSFSFFYHEVFLRKSWIYHVKMLTCPYSFLSYSLQGVMSNLKRWLNNNSVLKKLKY